MPPSAVISATMQMILEVPISSATSRFLASRGLFMAGLAFYLVHMRLALADVFVEAAGVAASTPMLAVRRARPL